jgi:hypothetical protein
MGLMFPFNQEEFMAKWTYRDKESDPGRSAVIKSGACTAFSALFAKRFQAGMSMSVDDQQFVGHLIEFFRRNVEKIVKCQQMGKEVHASSGKGYEFVLSLVELQPAGEMVQVSSQMFDIGNVQGCLHVFSTSFVPAEKHTIAHLVSGNLVATFDPNYGLWVNAKDAWPSFILSFMASKYNVATQSSFLALKIS